MNGPVFDLNLPPSCPPDAAFARDQKAFRVVRQDPPGPNDLLTHQELGTAHNADPCRRAAISVYLTYEQAIHRLELSPHLGQHVAAVDLTAAHGPISPPQPHSGHMDWWPLRGMRRHSEFKLVQT